MQSHFQNRTSGFCSGCERRPAGNYRDFQKGAGHPRAAFADSFAFARHAGRENYESERRRRCGFGNSFLKPNSLVLDAGCGAGTKSKYLIDRGLKVVGIDFSDKLIEIAKREAPSGNFFVMDINEADKLKENFDGIFAQAVLLHIQKKDAEKTLNKLLGVLKPGGYLYIAVKEKKFGGADEEIKTENDYGYPYERFFSYFTLDEIKNLFYGLD